MRVHDLGETGGVRFVSMEYVPGTTLRAILGGRGGMALGPGLQIMKQMCRGLAAVHHAGIVHRDLKPENVMVLPNGTIKLMDFGIAEALGAVDETGQKKVVGTPQYMSPEQLRRQQIDGRSDLYAIGVMMYELFAGVSPFTGKNVTEIIQKSVLTEPQKPTTHCPDMPAALEQLILACLAKQPAGRPPEARVVYQSLMKIPSAT